MIQKTILFLAVSLHLFAVQTMHPKTYEGINEANEKIELKAYEEADAIFNELIEDTSNKRVYDLAFIYNAKAYLFIQKGNYKQAITSYKKALSYNILHPSMANNIIFSLAQLSIQEEQYNESIKYLKEWHKVKKPTISSSKLMMVNYLSLERNEDALKWCKKAISLSKVPSLELYQNQLALQIQLEQIKDAIDTLEFIIAKFKVSKNYFTQLSYLYQTIGDDKKSVAILESAYQLGLLTEYKEKIQLAQMLNYVEATQKAVQVVQTLLDDSNNTAKTLEYLAQLQLSTKEYSNAIINLEKLYKTTKEDKTALLLAQLFASNANWTECEKYASKLKTNEAKMLLAVSLAEQKKFDEAYKIFTHLLKAKEFKSQAKMWIEHIR